MKMKNENKKWKHRNNEGKKVLNLIFPACVLQKSFSIYFRIRKKKKKISFFQICFQVSFIKKIFCFDIWYPLFITIDASEIISGNFSLVRCTYNQGSK